MENWGTDGVDETTQHGREYTNDNGRTARAADTAGRTAHSFGGATRMPTLLADPSSVQSGGPKTRKRFVNRAHSLTTDPAYRQRLERFIQDWNAMHPVYSIGVRVAPPGSLHDTNGRQVRQPVRGDYPSPLWIDASGVVYPPALEAAMEPLRRDNREVVEGNGFLVTQAM